MRRVFVIGLDGATLDLIGPWAAQGELPTFSRLMREGVFGPLRSTEESQGCLPYLKRVNLEFIRQMEMRNFGRAIYKLRFLI